MPHEMFDEVVNPLVKVGTRKWYSVPLSITCHTLVLGACVGAPLVATDFLPLPNSIIVFKVPPPPPQVQPEPTPPTRVRSEDSPVEINRDAAPLEAPNALTAEPAYQPPTLGVVGSSQTQAFGVGDGSGVNIAAPPPPSSDKPLRVGGAIQAPRLVRRVDPVYPAIGRNARLQGSVVIDATIARDGTVKDVRLTKSAHPLLDKAALDAVSQWRYSPTLINGDAVEVTLSVTVTFALH